MGISLAEFSEKEREEMIFVDTSALFPLYNISDSHHIKAVEIARNLQEEQITSNIIISEVLTLLSMRVKRQIAINFGKSLTEGGLRIIFIDQILHQNAWKIFQSIKDKDVSFADCTSFAVMEVLGIKKAFSFDEDFKRYGLETIEV